MEDLDRIRSDIRRAREWIEVHFNAYRNEEETPSGMLNEKTYLVEYPDVDRACIIPMLFGKPFDRALGAEYRLIWKGGRLLWRGSPVLRPDIVVDLEVPDEMSEL